MASRNSFLDSKRYRKITAPQRDKIEERRKESGFTGTGSKSDPIKRKSSGGSSSSKNKSESTSNTTNNSTTNNSTSTKAIPKTITAAKSRFGSASRRLQEITVQTATQQVKDQSTTTTRPAAGTAEQQRADMFNPFGNEPLQPTRTPVPEVNARRVDQGSKGRAEATRQFINRQVDRNNRRNAKLDVPISTPPSVLEPAVEGNTRRLRQAIEGRSIPDRVRTTSNLLLDRARSNSNTNKPVAAARDVVAGGLLSATATGLEVAEDLGRAAVNTGRNAPTVLDEFLQDPQAPSRKLREQIQKVAADPIGTVRKTREFEQELLVTAGTAVATRAARDPVGLVAEVALFDGAFRTVDRAADTAAFIGKPIRRTDEIVDFQSLFGVSEDFLQEVSYPVSQADRLTTRRTQSRGSDKIVDNINEQGTSFTAMPERIRVDTVDGKNQFKVLNRDEIEDLLGAPQAADAGGLFASDKTSSAFLGLGSERRYGVGLPSSSEPTILRVETTAARLPKDARSSFEAGDLLIQDATELAARGLDPAAARISPNREARLKTEKEVIIPAGNTIQETSEFTALQKALGRDFDEGVLVPTNIPKNQLQSELTILDEAGDVKTAPGSNFIDPVPVSPFRLVRVVNAKNVGLLDDAARAASTTTSNANRRSSSSSSRGTTRSRNVAFTPRISQSDILQNETSRSQSRTSRGSRAASSSGGGSRTSPSSILSSSASRSPSSSGSSSASSSGSSSGSSSSGSSSSGSSGGGSSSSNPPRRSRGTSSSSSSSLLRSSTTTVRTPIASRSKQSNGLFDVQVRNKGVFESIGVAKSIEEATRKGTEAVRNTARASFKIISGGETVDLLDTPTDFRRSKKDSNVFVEKRNKRINTLGEVNELRTARSILA